MLNIVLQSWKQIWTTLKRLFACTSAHFFVPGGVNRQNCRICDSKRPQEIYGVLQGAASGTARYIVFEKDVVKNCSLENESAAGGSCKKILCNFFYLRVQDYA